MRSGALASSGGRHRLAGSQPVGTLPAVPISLRFHATGDWLPDQVTVTWSPGTRRTVPEVEALIERAWSAVTARPGVHLFDGPMCRAESWRAAPDRLELAVSPTSYKPFLGTNLSHPGLADRYGPGVMANPAGVSAALVTADGFFLLGRRNASVAYYPGRVHPFAGALEPRDVAAAGDAGRPGGAFAAVYRELNEELGLGPTDLEDVRCAAVVEDLALRQPELIFRARTPRTRAEVEAQVDRAEHHALWAVRADRDGLDPALRDPALTPVAAASVLLWGKVAFGEAWFTSRAKSFTAG